MNRKTIFHIIDSLATGGAEVLLKNSVSLLLEFNHVIIYLHPLDQLAKEFEGSVDFVCLHYKGWSGMPAAILQLRRLIRQHRPCLVHSHLWISTICARMAVPRDIPLLTTLHSTFSVDAFKKNRKSIWAERLTLKQRHILVAVSAFVLNDYLSYIPFAGKRFVLHNFLPKIFFENVARPPASDTLRCVAIGNLKEAKNYHFLLAVFAQLKQENISLDIYGTGSLEQELQAKVERDGARVRLRGKAKNIRETLGQYDLFIQASLHEGFGLSVIEAMASGLPVVLSNIEVFQEITNGQAWFFPPAAPDEAGSLLLQLKNNEMLRNKYVESALAYCKAHYTALEYKQRLMKIYHQALN